MIKETHPYTIAIRYLLSKYGETYRGTFKEVTNLKDKEIELLISQHQYSPWMINKELLNALYKRKIISAFRYTKLLKLC